MTHRKNSRQVLCDRLFEIINRYGSQIAVRDCDQHYTYKYFGLMIQYLRACLNTSPSSSEAPIGLLLERGISAYASMWAALSLGRAYVPLNVSYPASRLKKIIEQSGVSIVICNTRSLKIAKDLQVSCDQILDISNLLEKASKSQDNSSDHIVDCNWNCTFQSENPAYIMFTSGTTGVPKGVPISCDNLLAFIDNLNRMIDYKPTDVCSQLCELSFDVSVHEIYLALLNGCTLCPARPIDLFNPARYISTHAISVCIGVPSLIRVLVNNGAPTNDSLNSIRISMFNGEPLSSSLVSQWQALIPHAHIWNTYGPTECTVAVSMLPCSNEPYPSKAGIVSIGELFPDVKAALLHNGKLQHLVDVEDGSSGELLLSGPQRFNGYSDASIASPFILDQQGECFYQTGDLVLYCDSGLFHLGRIDHQVKIRGHRIEILEVEHRVRQLYQSESLLVIAYPETHPQRLVLFIEKHLQAIPLHKEELQLPEYMIPSQTITLDKLPTNAHGKLDRAALQELVILHEM